jgi:hypothetical protein
MRVVIGSLMRVDDFTMCSFHKLVIDKPCWFAQ